MRFVRFWAACCVFCAALPLSGAAFTYVDWTSSTTTGGVTTVLGTLAGGINVTYTGETSFVQTTGGTNYYSGWSSIYTNGTVSNLPPSADIIAILGNSTTHTVTFSSPVSNLIMDIVSLGQPSIQTNYTFNQTFSILSQGPAAFGGPGTLLASNGNTTLTGIEGDGVVMFAGPVTTLTWTGASPENWNGFTFGITGDITSTPEPSTVGLVLGGLALGGLRLLRKRT